MICNQIIGLFYATTIFSGLSFILLGMMSRRLEKIESCLAQYEDDESAETDSHTD